MPLDRLELTQLRGFVHFSLKVVNAQLVPSVDGSLRKCTFESDSVADPARAASLNRGFAKIKKISALVSVRTRRLADIERVVSVFAETRGGANKQIYHIPPPKVVRPLPLIISRSTTYQLFVFSSISVFAPRIRFDRIYGLTLCL